MYAVLLVIPLVLLLKSSPAAAPAKGLSSR